MLARATLTTSFARFFRDGTMPGANALSEWMAAYVPYAMTANAGPCFPSIRVATVESSNFFQSVELSLTRMWVEAVWLGPGATGTTLSVPPLSPVLYQIGSSLITGATAERALQLITDAFHTYTLGIVVAVVTAGVSSPTPLT